MIEIGKLQKATSKALEELLALSRLLHVGDQTMSLDELEELVKSENAVVMVASDAGRIIGMANLYFIPKVGNKKAYIEDVVVDSGYREQGLGAKLMQALIDAARAGGADSVSLTSRPERTAAHALYQKLGFKKHETDVFRLTLH